MGEAKRRLQATPSEKLAMLRRRLGGGPLDMHCSHRRRSSLRSRQTICPWRCGNCRSGMRRSDD
jgi:hypothetical protein